MQAERPTQLIDPVCGMTVDVAHAEAGGLLLEHERRTFAFCRSECRSTFVVDPAAYVADALAGAGADAAVAPATAVSDGDLPVIDEGMRRWYESCACCLSDSYPEIKAQLDAERSAASQPPVDPGICEVAEAAEAAQTLAPAH